eukprot:scaffold19042_cov53-Attheya_sp.AAC.1
MANAPTDGRGSMRAMANVGSKQVTSASMSTSGEKSLASIHRVALSRILFGGSKPKSKRIEGDPHLARSHGDDRYNKNTDASNTQITMGVHQESSSGPSVQAMQKELLSLQRRKAFLRGEMERFACLNGMLHEDGDFNATEITVADEIESVRAQAIEMESRPYLHQYDDRDGSGLLMTQKRKGGPPNINMLDDVTGSIASTSELVSSTSNLPAIELQALHNDGSAERNNVSMTARMHSVRKRRRIVASHRLAGISAMNLTQDDNGVMGARMDVCGPDGRFVARYHVFFDAIRVREEQLNATGGGGGSTKSDDFFTSDDALLDSINNNNNQESQDGSNQWTTFLRLVQHTLPPGVPATDIMKRNFPPQGMLELDTAVSKMNENEEHSGSHEASASATMVMNKLRQCIGDMYDACHVHVLRRDFFLILKKMVQEEPESSRYSSKQGDITKIETIVLIENPLSTDAFDLISFEIKTYKSDYLPEGESQNSSPELVDLYLTVQLRYDNMMNALPTEAIIRIKVEEESDNDENATIDSNTSTHFAFLFEQMRTHFLGLPLPGAVEKNIALIRNHGQGDSCTGTL